VPEMDGLGTGLPVDSPGFADMAAEKNGRKAGHLIGWAVAACLCWITFQAGPAVSAWADQQKEDGAEAAMVAKAQALMTQTIVAGKIDPLIALLPPGSADCKWKRAKIDARLQQRRKQIERWLGGDGNWELDRVVKRPDGRWKVRFQFQASAPESTRKPRLKTIHFTFRRIGHKWCLAYIGGWDGKNGEMCFWP
jgi:hypothetical protein